MNRRKEYIKSCAVSEIKAYELNGYRQKVLIEGKNAESPLIIYLHGGPGSPLPFCAGSRGLFPEITDNFIMVRWDQLGCGANDYVIDDSFSIENYVGMTVDLIKAVHRDFPDNPVNLFGVSWGSVLAANAAVKIPELINRVTVYGQITKNLFFNEEVFGALENSKLNGKERSALSAVKSKSSGDISQKDISITAKLIRKHTEGYSAKNGGKNPVGKIIWRLLTSPDYTLKDFKAVMINGTMGNRSLYKELIRLDLSGILKSVGIPYFIMQGEKDIVTSPKHLGSVLAENNNLNLCIVPNSGHIPGGDGMSYIIQKGFGFFK